MRVIPGLLAAGLTLASCDGPRENAGEKADAAAGVVDSEDTMRSGPAEEMGARQDDAAEMRADAKEAQADSIEASAAETSEAASQRAAALREAAEADRNAEPADVNGM